MACLKRSTASGSTRCFLQSNLADRHHLAPSEHLHTALFSILPRAQRKLNISEEQLQLLLPVCFSPQLHKQCKCCLGEALWLSRRLEEQDRSLQQGDLPTPGTPSVLCWPPRGLTCTWVQYAWLSRGFCGTSSAVWHIPLAISCLPRKQEIFARRFRTAGLSFTVSITCLSQRSGTPFRQ